MPGLSNVMAIAAGGYHSLALLRDGTLMASGYNAYGELGDGTTTGRDTFEKITTGVRGIAGEAYDSLAAMSNGTLEGWGQNSWGELGDGTANEVNSPEHISFPTGVYALGQGDGNEESMVLQGATGQLSVSALHFGSQRVGHGGARRTLTLTNFGPAPLAVAGETLTGAGARSFSKLCFSSTAMNVLRDVSLTGVGRTG